MALDPHPLDPVALGGGDERLPEIGVLDRFLRRGLPAVLAPAVDPSGEPVHHVAAVGGERDAAWALECVQRLDHGGQLHAVVGGVGRAARQLLLEFGSASCRERVCQYVSFSVVPVALKTNTLNHTKT